MGNRFYSFKFKIFYFYKKISFKYEDRDVMAYSMKKKTPFKYPSTRYLNIIKQGYKDCDLDTKFLAEALKG